MLLLFIFQRDIAEVHAFVWAYINKKIDVEYAVEVAFQMII